MVCSYITFHETDFYILNSKRIADGTNGKLPCTMITSSNGNFFRVTGHLCAGPGEFPTQRPVTWSFDVFFDLPLNKRLSKQSWGWWFETLSHLLWRHRNDTSSSLCRWCIWYFGILSKRVAVPRKLFDLFSLIRLMGFVDEAVISASVVYHYHCSAMCNRFYHNTSDIYYSRTLVAGWDFDTEKYYAYYLSIS